MVLYVTFFLVLSLSFLPVSFSDSQETKAAVGGQSPTVDGPPGSAGTGGPLLNIPEPRGLGSFRGGSLPNVAQGSGPVGGQGPLRGSRGSANGGSAGGDSQIDLAGALNSLECMKRGDVSPNRGRSHHRQRAATASSHQRVSNATTFHSDIAAIRDTGRSVSRSSVL